MSNCKGLKGRKYTKCMKAYNAASKKIFPTFNQPTDTVITTQGKGSRSAILAHNRLSASSYGKPELNSQRTSMWSDGTIKASTLVKKSTKNKR